ncbi:MAG TPA: four helix bundle protein, partial [Chryseolinea sp.]
MFDFEKLDVYKKAKAFNSGIRAFIKDTKLDNTTRDQLRRASFSIVLNLAEGSGRFSYPDRKNFYIISRSSVFECVAIMDVL